MRRRQSGFAFLTVLLLAALALIALSVALPVVRTQLRREKEEELIFRGNQYSRAIGLYFRRYGRFPMKIGDLLRSNDRSYLRRAWPDPMSPDGRWRLIRVGPNGELLGSVHKPTLSDLGLSEESPRSRGTRSRQDRQKDEDADSPYPIVGVASNNPSPSIRVYDGYGHYDEWEFVYDPTNALLQRGRRGGPPTRRRP